MRQVAIFSEKTKTQLFKKVDVLHNRDQHFDLYKRTIACGLLQCSDTLFDSTSNLNQDKVLVRKKAFSCNFRDKSVALTAKYSLDVYAKNGHAKFYALGSEFVGEVIQKGAAVTNLEIGDMVIGNGNYPYSGYDNVRPGLPTNNTSKELDIFHFSKLVKVPISMPIEVAAGFSIGGQTAYSMIRKLCLQKGEKILITAATSNTSLFAINALRKLDVDVYAITTRAKYGERLKELGVKEVFVNNHDTKSLQENPAITKHKFNAVIDPLFDIYASTVIPLLDYEGRYITCGFNNQFSASSKQKNKATPENNFLAIMKTAIGNNLNLMGNCIGHTQDLENAIRDYENGDLKVVIDSVFQEEQIEDFFNKSFKGIFEIIFNS
jgi:NADPH:quinone reductase-like Zn-dependent oxidoreductase